MIQHPPAPVHSVKKATLPGHEDGLITLAILTVARTAASGSLTPHTIILLGVNVTRNLLELKRAARLLVESVEGEGGCHAGTSRTQAMLEARKTVLAACPLGDGELAGVSPVGSLANVPAVDDVVDPFIGAATAVGHAVDVADAEAVVGVDGVSSIAGFRLAELEFAEDVSIAICGGRVVAVVIIAQVQPVLHLEHVALPYNTPQG